LEEDRIILYVDEAGFNLNVKTGKTWAIKGKTPCLKEGCRYKHISAISAISPCGELFFKLQDRSFLGGDVVAFLKDVLTVLDKKILAIWDGAAIHRDKHVKAFLEEEARTGANRVFLERLPPYSPDLNADEQVWQTLKDDMLKNVICKNLTELQDKVSSAFAILKQDVHKIKKFFFHKDVNFY